MTILQSDLVTVSSTISQIDATTKLAPVGRSEIILIDPIVIPDDVLSIDTIIDAPTDADPTLYQDADNPLQWIEEYSLDGGKTWIEAAGFGLHGGRQYEYNYKTGEKDIVFPYIVFGHTVNNREASFKGKLWRVRVVCDSGSSQIIKPVVTFNRGQRIIDVPHQSVTYEDHASAYSSSSSSILTGTISNSGPNGAWCAAVFNQYSVTVTD